MPPAKPQTICPAMTYPLVPSPRPRQMTINLILWHHPIIAAVC
jgi:hypothetical protein